MELIAAKYYYDIYLILVSILTFTTINRYLQRSGNTLIYSSKLSNVTGVLLVITIILFIGLRPVNDIFVDMVGYNNTYNVFFLKPFQFNYDTLNLLFDNILPFMASKGLPNWSYFLFIAALYFGLVYIACRRLFPRDSYAAFLVFLAAFSTFSYGVNGIKAGLAASIFILAVSYRDKLIISIPLALLTYTIHHSMTIVIVAFLISLINKNIKITLYFWIFCLIMAIFHVTYFQTLFANFADESGTNYLMSSISGMYVTGFRLDFIIYSIMPIWLGWHHINKHNSKISKTYSTLLQTYILTNSVWLLCMYAAFTNRIAYLSWFLYPIVLIYPYLNESYNGNRYLMFTKVAIIHLLFTLFMHFILF